MKLSVNSTIKGRNHLITSKLGNRAFLKTKAQNADEINNNNKQVTHPPDHQEKKPPYCI